MFLNGIDKYIYGKENIYFFIGVDIVGSVGVFYLVLVI